MSAAPVGATGTTASPTSDSLTWDIPGTDAWVVPDRVTSVTVVALGASGGDVQDGGFADGGLGGSTTASIKVSPGETLQVNVGGQGVAGTSTNPESGAPGGYNGGGAAVSTNCNTGGSGGGASDVRRGGTDLTDRVLVAGGGGGAGASMDSGQGGAGGGDEATAGQSPFFKGLGGGPGTLTAGGTGSSAGYDSGSDGSFGLGADNSTDGCLSSGAGGGGWYGGGSGSGEYPEAAGGGGGGSGYVVDGSTGVIWGNGVNEGDGSVTISYTQPPAPATATPTTSAPPVPKAPAASCPDPKAPLRAFLNRPSLLLAAYLIDNCGFHARSLVAAGMPVTALDPPASSVCPPWVPFRVWPNRPSITIAGFLIDHCGYSVHRQFDFMHLNSYVVPHGWTPGARVSR